MAALGDIGRIVDVLPSVQIAPIYTLSGTITRDGAAAFARLYILGAASKVLVGATISNPATGAFTARVLSTTPVEIIVTDDAGAYNDRVVTRVVPA